MAKGLARVRGMIRVAKIADVSGIHVKTQFVGPKVHIAIIELFREP